MAFKDKFLQFAGDMNKRFGTEASQTKIRARVFTVPDKPSNKAFDASKLASVGKKIKDLEGKLQEKDLDEPSNEELDRLAADIISKKELKVDIQGHTDSQGDDEINDPLSEARAAAVRDALIKRGVPEDQLTSSGNGEKKPIAPNWKSEKDNNGNYIRNEAEVDTPPYYGWTPVLDESGNPIANPEGMQANRNVSINIPSKDSPDYSKEEAALEEALKLKEELEENK
jgi:outer membrane protein OmpA-like peptidoglycan-associated protein